MRKLLSVTIIAVVTSASGCSQCWDNFVTFEHWKNQTLFGCLGHRNNCPPADPCATPYQAGQPIYGSPLVGGAIVGDQTFGAPYADCSGSVVVGTPAVTDGCSTCAPGTIVTPGAGLVPTPVPSLVPGPETYAPLP